jgi:hypothetical protein
MPWWWPFEKQKPTPFVQHIIESLASNPDAWSLSEKQEVERYVPCEKDHPDAEHSHWRDKLFDYGSVQKFKRPIKRSVFRLTHTGGTIVIMDPDATSYDGWVVEEPRHVIITDFDSIKLSEAVKKWREHMVLHELTLHTPERKLLEAAYEELEEDLGGGPKDQIG